ncbi:hypothetical protein MHU86_407 [Fragilaria crotonensis]|nr:hypothetical protein MHU86_407 [Fragilaria crotonensis]
MDIVEDDLDNNGDANRDIGEPNEVPSAAIQQLVRLLPPLALPTVAIRQPLDAIHHHPFRMFQHFHHIPSRNLFFTEAMLMDTINGTIHLRDLPLCVRTSATISAFCINTLADPPELNIIRGLDKHFIHHILRHVIRDHMYIDELISGTNIPLLNVQPDKLLLLRSMKHTLNRATNMVVQHLNDQQRSQFLPAELREHSATLTTRSTTTPRLSDGNTMRTEHYFYPDHLFAIAKEIKSTATALSLLPDTTTFNLLPRFVHDAFDEVDDLFPGTSLGHRSDQYYRDKLPYLQTEFELVQPYVTDYINSFPTPSTEAKEIASDRACELINVALFQHAIIHHMFLSSFATCYPMITKPSDVQLTFDNVTEDTLAINHVICNPLILQELISMNRFDSDPLTYMEIYNRLTPIATDTVNDSIDFLPHFEYVLFRVVQLLHPKDPTGIIRENYPPTNVVIFQGSPLQAPTYCFGSPTEIAIPTPTTGAFPINLDHSGDPIIVNNISGEAYNRSTVQRLFRTQTAKPIHPDQVNDPDWIPRHTADLRRHPDADLYHVACDPKRIPFSLAVRLIPVYTTGPSGQTIYQAWALPHLNNALRDLNCNYSTISSLTITLQRKTTLSSHSLISWDLIHLFQTMIESVASNNIITFQQDNSTFSGPHFACLAVSTRRSSLLSDPTRTPDPQDEIPAQNDPQTQIFAPNEPQTAIFTHDEHGDEIPAQNDTTSENPTQNDTISPEIHSQQLISDAETTYDEHAQTTQQLPGTQPNLAFLPPNSPETSSSHTETPSNSPPTAKSTTGPLKRFSDAFSGILTPKNVKLPHNPDATDSNPQPPISTTFSTTPKIIPTKKFPPQNSNPQPPNPSQNLSQPQIQHNEIIQPPSTKSAKPTQKSPNFGNDDQNPQNAPKSVATRPTPRQATHNLHIPSHC